MLILVQQKQKTQPFSKKHGCKFTRNKQNIANIYKYIHIIYTIYYIILHYIILYYIIIYKYILVIPCAFYVGTLWTNWKYESRQPSLQKLNTCHWQGQQKPIQKPLKYIEKNWSQGSDLFNFKPNDHFNSFSTQIPIFQRGVHLLLHQQLSPFLFLGGREFSGFPTPFWSSRFTTCQSHRFV